MASLLDLAQARLGGLLAPRPSMAGLLGGQRTQANLASALQGYTPPQMTALTNPQVMDYARNVAQTAQQNLQTQMSDLDKALVMGQQGIQVGDREALARLMEQVPGLMGATAYHGTPHNIRGKFDISKVGTGEGAQAYGHGMYFAENPKVAQEYQKMLAGPEQTASEYLKLYKTPESAISALQYGITPNLTPEAKKFSQDAIDVLRSGKELKGNLYKVDIPDKDIPMMLDWDKPLLQQTPQVQEALAKLGIKTDAKKLNEFDDALLNALTGDAKSPLPKQPINPTGSDIYRTFIQGNPQLTSQKLNEVGIKGIRYLDEGSRVDVKYNGDPAYTNAGISFKESGYTPQDALQGMKQAYKNADPKELELAINDVYGIQSKTSNFVVFEPSTVKILEKNSQKVEGLLD